MSTKWQLIIILTISVAVHFTFFGHPNETVFDEVHFGKFISAYYTGEYYFDIHPPLGKLMIAGFAKLFDFEPQYSFVNIGDKFPDNKYLALRFLPTLAGTLLPLIIYFLVLELGLSRMAAFAGGLLLVFENSLLTQSRLILLDPFLLLFGFLSLLFYFKYKKHKPLNTKYLILNTIFAGFAISIKWTGLSFIALPILIEAVENINLKTGIKLTIVKFIPVLRFISFFTISIAIYFSVFALHFALLPKPGSGDAFMKTGFRQQNIIENFRDLNIEMYRSNQRISVSHPYSSQWYTWSSMSRPIYYWVNNNSRIYFFGNPIVWWASTAAVIVLLLRNLQFSKPTLRSAPRTFGVGVYNFQSILNFKIKNLNFKPEQILLLGFALNLLPFIGVKRVMFLYHYLTALIFAILMLCYLIDRNKNSRKIFTGIVIASIVTFFFFAPLNYGLPLSDKAYSARIWFASWR